MLKNCVLALALFAMFAGVGLSNAALIGTASIRAPAVILSNNTGSLTNITLAITSGNGTVKVTGPQHVGASTLQSAYVAAGYASNYTGRVFSNYNFTYNIADAGDNVSGPSAGAAMTMLAVSAFMNRPLRTDFTMTGTISGNGSIGQIGGVYDKAGAAKTAGATLILVPKVPPNDSTDKLYLLVQTNFGIPLVQVANISQASHFAFNSNINGAANKTAYNFFNNYNVTALPYASINCSASCNYSIFSSLLNTTFNLTNGEIRTLGSNPRFYNISLQLQRVLNQSMALSKRGYVYAAANFAFQDYVDAFYFSGYSTNRSSALSLLTSVQSFCNSLMPAQLTTGNYNYVISAELRNMWGNYTINNLVSAYNASQIDSDQILDELYLGAQANGWCTAANLVYNQSANQQGSQYLVPSASLSRLASRRIGRALPYGTSIYLATAQLAYKQGNYPLAIIDADYAFAFANASLQFGLPAQQLNSLALKNAVNATYGVWATEFSHEAQFYVSESNSAGAAHPALTKSYAETGYSAALLAILISNDTRIIRNNMTVSSTPPTTVQPTNSSAPGLINSIVYGEGVIFTMLSVIIALLLVNIVLMAIMIGKINHTNRPKGLNQARRKR